MMTTATATSAPLKERWNTLQMLKASRVALFALDALLLMAVLVGAGMHREAMQIVGKDTAPSMIAAQHIKAALADMDADLANELLVPAGKAASSPVAYDRRRVEAAKALISAARNITLDATEEVPIESVQVNSGRYEQLAQQARDLQQGSKELSTRVYRDAGNLMDGTVLPAADDLDKANNDELEREYERKRRDSAAARFFIGLVGLAALAVLAWAQLFLSRRMRRTLNPALLVATVLTLGLTVYAFASMAREAHDLKVAKEDAFTSIHALWQARATAYAANGSESRYLLDPLHAGEYEAQFFARANALAVMPRSVPVEQVLATESRGGTVPGFTGYLADELNNITFAGEREAAVRTLAAFERYMAVDAEMRRLEKAGEHQRAIDLCIGTAEGQSDWAFEQFDQALGVTLEINQHAFDVAVEEGFAALRGMEWKAGVVAVAIAVLVFLGLAPRIREYE